MHFNDILCFKYIDVRSIICENVYNKHTVFEDTLSIITAFIYLQRYVVNLIINKEAKHYSKIPIDANSICFTKILKLNGFKTLLNTIGFNIRGNNINYIQYDYDDDHDTGLVRLKAISQEMQKLYGFLASCMENNEYLVDMFEKVCKNLQCLICKENQAVYDCRLCNLFFCEKCIGIYHGNPDNESLLQHFVDDKIKLINQLFGNFLKYLESFEDKDKLKAFKLQTILDEVNDNAKFLYKTEFSEEDETEADSYLIPIIKKLSTESAITDDDYNKILSLTEKLNTRTELINYIADRFKPDMMLVNTNNSNRKKNNVDSCDKFLKDFDEFHMITRNEVLKRSNKNYVSIDTTTKMTDSSDTSESSIDEKMEEKDAVTTTTTTSVKSDHHSHVSISNDRDIEIEVNQYLKMVKEKIKPNKIDEMNLVNAVFSKIKSLTMTLRDQRFKENFKQTNCKNFLRAWVMYKNVDVQFAHLKDIILNDYAFEKCCNYLNNICAMCNQQFHLYELISLMYCTCKTCMKCFKKEYIMRIDTKINQLIEIRRFSCLTCPRPDCLKSDRVVIDTHFKNLSNLIRKYISDEYFSKFTSIIAKCRGIQKDPLFRWCAHCDNGFVWNQSSLKMECQNCFNHTCSNCHAKWENEHDNLTCREYQGLKAISEAHANKFLIGEHLAERKILCTNCYSLHKLKDYECENLCFTCSLCKHIFCLSCSAFYKLPASCKSKKPCRETTFHAHHLRNCEYYLRNYPVDLLLKLIEDSTESFGFPNLKTTNSRCKVNRIENKMGIAFECSKPVYKQNDLYNGYCESHLKTHLILVLQRKFIVNQQKV